MKRILLATSCIALLSCGPSLNEVDAAHDQIYNAPAEAVVAAPSETSPPPESGEELNIDDEIKKAQQQPSLDAVTKAQFAVLGVHGASYQCDRYEATKSDDEVTDPIKAYFEKYPDKDFENLSNAVFMRKVLSFALGLGYSPVEIKRFIEENAEPTNEQVCDFIDRVTEKYAFTRQYVRAVVPEEVAQ